MPQINSCFKFKSICFKIKIISWQLKTHNFFFFNNKLLTKFTIFFITIYAPFVCFTDCCFMVQVPKGPRGLGLSVSGGVDTNAVFPGLIRIKRLFPHQSAWCTGMLQPGDILLEANGTPLTGLTNYVSFFLSNFV